MAKKFEIDIKGVQRTQPQIKRPIKSISKIENSFNSLRWQINSEIKRRSNVDEELLKAGNFLVEAENRLHRIDRFVISSVGEYEEKEKYLEAKAKELVDGWNPQSMIDISKILRGATISLASALGNPGDWLYKSGVQFFLQEKNGKTTIKVGKWSWDIRNFFHKPLDPGRWQEIKDKLRRGLQTGRHTFSKSELQLLMTEGLHLYNNQTRDYYNKNYNKFSRDAFPEMRNTFDDFIGTNRLQRAGRAFMDNINPVDDFRGWLSKDVSNLGKVAKLPGILGIGIDVWDNRETIRNSSGKVDFWSSSAEQQRKFVVDTSVDVMTGSAAMATGAALGSLIAPPVGTVVGAGAGVFIYGMTNWKFFGDDPKKSAVDYAKNIANDAATNLADGFRKLDKIFW